MSRLLSLGSLFSLLYVTWICHRQLIASWLSAGMISRWKYKPSERTTRRSGHAGMRRSPGTCHTPISWLNPNAASARAVRDCHGFTSLGTHSSPRKACSARRTVPPLPRASSEPFWGFCASPAACRHLRGLRRRARALARPYLDTAGGTLGPYVRNVPFGAGECTYARLRPGWPGQASVAAWAITICVTSRESWALVREGSGPLHARPARFRRESGGWVYARACRRHTPLRGWGRASPCPVSVAVPKRRGDHTRACADLGVVRRALRAPARGWRPCGVSGCVPRGCSAGQRRGLQASVTPAHGAGGPPWQLPECPGSAKTTCACADLDVRGVWCFDVVPRAFLQSGAAPPLAPTSHGGSPDGCPSHVSAPAIRTGVRARAHAGFPGSHDRASGVAGSRVCWHNAPAGAGPTHPIVRGVGAGSSRRGASGVAASPGLVCDRAGYFGAVPRAPPGCARVFSDVRSAGTALTTCRSSSPLAAARAISAHLGRIRFASGPRRTRCRSCGFRRVRLVPRVLRVLAGGAQAPGVAGARSCGVSASGAVNVVHPVSLAHRNVANVRGILVCFDVVPRVFLRLGSRPCGPRWFACGAGSWPASVGTMIMRGWRVFWRSFCARRRACDSAGCRF